MTRATVILIGILAGSFVFSSVNTYLLFDKTRNLQAQLGVEQYDYIVFQKNGLVEAKNGTSGAIDFASKDAAAVISQTLAEGNNTYIKSDVYTLNSSITIYNKRNAEIYGDGATIIANGNQIIIKGDTYATSQYNSLSNINLFNGTIRIENSFGATISNIIFENCSTALELVNSNTWTEGTKIEDCSFKDSTENIVFRTNTSLATGSYSSTQINRCYFNLNDNSVAIKVEPEAELTDSLLQNVRVWMGETGETNQTGLELNGSMYKTQLSGVVFESFAAQPNSFYAMTIGETAYQSPIIAGGVNFLGNWTARIHDPYSKWIYGFGSAFKTVETIPIGAANRYGSTETINLYPSTITSFRTKIDVQGSFRNNETITVSLRLELIDNSQTTSVTKTFSNSSSIWLTDDDMLTLFPSQNIIWAILVEAKTSTAITDATVTIDIYGVTT